LLDCFFDKEHPYKCLWWSEYIKGSKFHVETTCTVGQKFVGTVGQKFFPCLIAFLIKNILPNFYDDRSILRSPNFMLKQLAQWVRNLFAQWVRNFLLAWLFFDKEHHYQFLWWSEYVKGYKFHVETTCTVGQKIFGTVGQKFFPCLIVFLIKNILTNFYDDRSMLRGPNSMSKQLGDRQTDQQTNRPTDRHSQL